MSFKREGDDQSQLNVLKKRRVADLLSNFISDDEAVLMKNGRYSCLVCSHRPVFDTVDMLMVHRKGKRHLEGMKWFYGKKNKLQREIDKRRHQDYVKAEDDVRQEPSSSAPLLSQTRKITHHALLRTAPYSSCHRKASERAESLGCGQEDGNDQASNINSHTSMSTGSIDSMSITSTTGQTEGKGTTKKGSSIVTSTDCEPLTEQRRRELDHYLKLKSSGWLQDRSGKWVKDENVEFDSDEEEPALLPPESS
ncbi:sodium channel modifier 1 isoform X2 [Pimephales promelas]|uniref:sodium channel modifier 1 isoform X2 n=1 Tax=Pimephales promelas TaxID=90988 RepID=UPI001955D249|nr:sodium channel modifier 1 isoform X2 [Pimephales promelas]KAG1947973.1 sodium channel modifier [Pimephales promelas]